MIVSTPISSGGWRSRLRWALVDSGTLTRRDLSHRRNQPGLVLLDIAFPVMILLMFGYLLGGAIAVPGGDYREFLVPGVLAITMVFGIESTFTAISTDAQRGVTDRFRSMPMSAAAVVVGRCVADLLHAVVVLAALILAGWAVGWQWHHGIGSALAAVGLLLLLRAAMLWVGIYLGLALRNPAAVVSLQILVWPLAFLSNAFVAPATMPSWLGAIAQWNPLSATVAATRELFGNPSGGGETWLAQQAIPLAVGWPLLLTAVFFPLAVRSYRRLAR